MGTSPNPVKLALSGRPCHRGRAGRRGLSGRRPCLVSRRWRG